MHYIQPKPQAGTCVSMKVIAEVLHGVSTQSSVFPAY